MSPRLKKPRRCESPYWGRAFKPTGTPMDRLERLLMEQDEVEALRLCDAEGLTQAEAGQRMGVSRGTVQRILAGARRKAAEAIAGGKAIVFEGRKPRRQSSTTNTIKNGGVIRDDNLLSSQRSPRAPE